MSRAFPSRAALAALVVPLVAGCASGTGHLESFLNELYPLDVAAAVGIVVLTNVPDLGWSTRVAEQGEKRYRIAVARERWTGAGDGEFGRRFGEAAQRVVTDRECGGFTVLAYAERYESALLGTRRIAEGLIECN
jgi:hypothetical protein